MRKPYFPLLAPALLATLGLVAVSTAQAQGTGSGVFRWVDKNGVVHYSDQPVQNSAEIELKTPPVSEPDPKAAAESSKRKADCDTKQTQLTSYQQASTISETDGLGNSRTYSAEEKQKLIDLTQKYISDNCATVASSQPSGTPQ